VRSLVTNMTSWGPNLRRYASMGSHRRHYGGCVPGTDALAALSTAPAIVGNWCLTSVRMCRRGMPIGAAKTATTTSSCAGTARRAGDQLNLNRSTSRRGLAGKLWLLGLLGLIMAGDDEMRVSKTAGRWRPRSEVRSRGDPVRYCLLSKC